MFHANGIQVYHYGDEQNQVIFWGPSAFDIIPIYHGDVSYSNDNSSSDTWYIQDDKTSRVIYESEDIEDVVTWVENNWFQYRNRLNVYTYTNNDMTRPIKKNKNL